MLLSLRRRKQVIIYCFGFTWESKMANDVKSKHVKNRSDGAFRVDVVADSLTKCSEGDLLVDEYITAYEELCIFFQLLGSVFGFITSDIKEKIGILKDFRNGHCNSNKYETVDGMMQHEIEVNRETNEALLGSRTLLRLHRALAFTMLFMEKLSLSSDHEKASTMASDAYSETLSKYHPWLIRKAANLAMYTLPSRGDMLGLVASGETDEGEVQKKVKNCVLAIRIVYDLVEALYTKYDLHGLP